MKKTYIAPELCVEEQLVEPIMLEVSVKYGGDYPGGPIDSKDFSDNELEKADLWNDLGF